MGSFQIRLEFGFISDHQRFAPHQETLFFQFGAEFGKVFPIKNAWSNFKFGRNSALFRLTEMDRLHAEFEISPCILNGNNLAEFGAELKI